MKISLPRHLKLMLCLLILGWMVFGFSCQHRTTETFRIMTFNIRYGTADDGENSWTYRQPRVIGLLNKYRPDILGVQEALDFQIEEIVSAFPNWRSFGLGRYYKIELSDRPHESLSGESCNIFYDTTKFHLIDHGTFWHSDSPEVPGSMSWGNSLPRITTWGILQMKKGHRKLLLMNTHFHWGEPYVRNAAELILKRCLAMANSMPIILMGDFNLPPNSWAHEFFGGELESAGIRGKFLDPWIELGKSERNAGTFNSFRGDRSGDRIDWILATSQIKFKDIRIIQDQIDGKFPSDHFPVIAIAYFQ